ncbi:putative isomerase YddE [Actinomadura rubteroloni]|uniref:Putative isomerase YddE n=1 Tax=Actinomadura rubteroloni TaxID=1926885 RepID=A0A2P4UG42_9ACTN|nr:putative isomerase YddE [Actinomadura rubteroloni]
MDAFTDRPFSGNPAAVCLLDAPADAAWMQDVAAEMRHSETAFVRRADDGTFELRWFTPLNEVALCGHATLATAHTLYHDGVVAAGDEIRFRTLRSGILTVRPGAEGALEMDFPAGPPVAAPAPAEFAALGTPFGWTGRNALNDWVVELPDAAAVRAVAPGIADLAGADARLVIVTAPADPGADHDFVSRTFAPRSLPGDAEDPVTGSAHCALAPYWAERLGRDALTGYQASARGGRVGVRLAGDRVVLTGRAVTVLSGDLLV